MLGNKAPLHTCPLSCITQVDKALRCGEIASKEEGKSKASSRIILHQSISKQLPVKDMHGFGYVP